MEVGDTLADLHLERTWAKYEGNAIKTQLKRKGLADVFSQSVREIEDSINHSNSFHEWRVTEGDIDPLHSNRWKEIRSDFMIDLESDVSIADQILEYQDERASGASWSGCPAAAPDSGEARVFVFGSESEGICGPRGAKLRSNSYVFLRG